MPARDFVCHLMHIAFDIQLRYYFHFNIKVCKMSNTGWKLWWVSWLFIKMIYHQVRLVMCCKPFSCLRIGIRIRFYRYSVSLWLSPIVWPDHQSKRTWWSPWTLQRHPSWAHHHLGGAVHSTLIDIPVGHMKYGASHHCCKCLSNISVETPCWNSSLWTRRRVLCLHTCV